MNILISKLDIARFTICPDKMKTYGGFDVGALVLLNMVKEYPQHTFYYIGSNDIPDLVDKPNNLIDLEQEIRYLNSHDRDHVKYEVAIEYCRQFKFDLAIYWYCRYTTLSKFKDVYINENGTPRKIRVYEKAFSHIMAVPTEFNVPIYYLIDDPNELGKFPYDINPPKSIWSQINTVVTYTHYNDKFTRIKLDANVEYRPIEKLWLQNKQKVDWRSFNKTNDFIVTCNGPTDNTDYKYRYVKKWVLNPLPNCTVYGKWDTSSRLTARIVKDHNADRFVNRGMCEMEDLMFNTKYTIVIPPSRKHPGFVTQKVLSMIYYGIIPFWCPDDYDKDGIYSDYPDYLKVKSPDELLHKINELNSNDKLYHDLLNKLYDFLDDRYFDNRMIHDLFDEILT